MENYLFTVDWFSGNAPNWQSWLGHLAGKPHVRFLEVGSYEGRSAVWLLDNVLTHETASLVCLDIFDSSAGGASGYEARFDHNMKTTLGRNKVEKIKGPSQEILRRMQLASYDAVYIDGSHIAADVLEDGILAFRLLRPGGIMIFDDYEWKPYPDPWMMPGMAIDSFLHVYERQYELLGKAYQVAIKKR
jgi:predicted O-methyltransferase YrrM